MSGKRRIRKRKTELEVLEARVRRLERRLLTVERVVADETTDGIWPPCDPSAVPEDALAHMLEDDGEAT